MLLPKKTNPAFSTYYCGAIVLKALIDSGRQELDFLELFRLSNLYSKISIKSFVLSLDWLYLLGSVKVNEANKVTLIEKLVDVS